MRLLRRVVGQLAVAAALIGGIGVLAAMFLDTADVVTTNFFNWPIPGTLELTESTMVLIVFGALATTQIRRGHIRMELIYVHMGPRVRAGMDAVTELAALAYFSLLTWQALGEAVISWRIREVTVGLILFPLYPARSVLVFGTGVLIAQLVLDVIHDVHLMIGKKPIETPE